MQIEPRALLSGVKNGNRLMFTLCYDRYHKGIYLFVLKYVRCAALAEDIVQDTLIRVWNRRDSWDTIENIEAFALTVCRNMALDRLRLHENQNASLDDTPVESNPTATANPYERTVQREKVQIVRQLIDALPEKQRACMQLRDMEGKTHKEIAAVLGITEEQVRVNIFRARQTIKQQFERYENYGLN